jgi:hypothetical protein
MRLTLAVMKMSSDNSHIMESSASDLLSRVMPASAELLRNRYFSPTIFITAAGFETRSTRTIERLRAGNANISSAFVFDYPDKELNEPNRSIILESVSTLTKEIRVVDVDEDGRGLRGTLSTCTGKVIVDISSMDRMILFAVLHELDACSLDCDILYTEAETYFPKHEMYEQLTRQNASNDVGFSRYLETERSEFAYSHDSRLIRLEEFFGIQEPGRPFMLISFFAFKRARLQLLMQEFEFEKKIFILGNPIREDLQWRKRCMEIINWDIIRKTPGAVYRLPTLYPKAVDEFLESQVYGSGDFARYNVLLSPLGSKMQTVGCFSFWRRHKEIGIVFSHPRKFYPPSYSQNARETFIVEFRAGGK